MSDLINRQAAIDELCDNCDNVKAVCAHYPCKQYIAIEQLPSAQPEILRCKDCKWYELPSHRIFENCVRWMESNGILLPIKPDDFCSRAERRTDE